jgi:hypothetical protein
LPDAYDLEGTFGGYSRRSTATSRSVTTSETTKDPKQPNRFEKKTNTAA